MRSKGYGSFINHEGVSGERVDGAKLGERVLSSCSCSKILGGGADGTHATDGIRLREAYGATGLIGHRSRIVSPRGMHVPGVLMLFKSSSTSTSTRTRTRTRTIEKELLRC